MYIFIRCAFSCCSPPELIFKQTMNRGVIDMTGSIGTEEGWRAGWWDVYIRMQRQQERDVTEGFFHVARTLIFHAPHNHRQRRSTCRRAALCFAPFICLKCRKRQENAYASRVVVTANECREERRALIHFSIRVQPSCSLAVSQDNYHYSWMRHNYVWLTCVGIRSSLLCKNILKLL